MRDWQSQAHVKHYCKYHVVFVPKYRKKSIYGALRKDIGGILRELCRQHGVELVEVRISANVTTRFADRDRPTHRLRTGMGFLR